MNNLKSWAAAGTCVRLVPLLFDRERGLETECRFVPTGCDDATTAYLCSRAVSSPPG